MDVIKCVDASAWDAFVDQSPQGNVFCRFSFLEAQGRDYDLWMAEKKGEMQMGAIVIKGQYNPMLYQGLLFSPIGSSFQPHKRAKWNLGITEEFIERMAQQYHKLEFRLHHSVEDIRALQWFNHDQPEQGRFDIKLRYTGIINLTDYPDYETYLSSIRQTRRNLYRQACNQRLTYRLSVATDVLDDLHERTFARQGIKRNEQEKRFLRSVSETALSEGMGELLICGTEAGEDVSATLFLYDQGGGYYLFGANHPEFRSMNAGTYLVLENIRRAFKKGIQFIDMCGINSPGRGDFKTSFNAMPVPYFECEWRQPSRR